MLDFTKKFKTRGGYPWRLYAQDGAQPYPIHIGVLFPNGWRSHSITENGRFNLDKQEHPCDLVCVPVKKIVEGWLNVYPFGATFYTERDAADSAASSSRIACLPFIHEYEE